MGSAPSPPCPISCIAMPRACSRIRKSIPRRRRRCRLPDFDGLPLDRYFVPELIIPYLATRGCYWGRCTFCDHGQGYFDQYRGMTAQQVVEQMKALRDKYQCRHFLFSDESYPPALFKKVSQLLVDQNVGIKWTTLIRFRRDAPGPGDLGSRGEGRLLHALLWDGVGERAGAEPHGQARQEERDPEQSPSWRRRRGSGTT